MTDNRWFTVDKEGLAKLVASRGPIVLLHELISNAWDTHTTRVDVTLEPVPGRALAKLEVRDEDPHGFADLAHAYTLFAESTRKGDPTKRGRFNLGEKMVLAMCEDAMISSTTGTVRFEKGGARKKLRSKTKAGSIFTATVRLTRDEVAEIDREIERIIPPHNVVTTYNGREVGHHRAGDEPERQNPSLCDRLVKLPTVIGDDEGRLRRTVRQTHISIYSADGPGWLYEMGIPVVETGDGFDVNVWQKVPLNMDRDNVTPAYLRQLRAEVLNAVADRHLDEEAARASWVTDALSHDNVEGDAVRATVTKRFGDDAVVYDPSDREANHTAAAHDAPVIHGGSLPKAAWANVREHKALPPAGQVFPTHTGTASGRQLEDHEVTDAMRRVTVVVGLLAHELLDPAVTVGVTFIDSPDASTRADYKRVDDEVGAMRFNVANLGPEWFEVRPYDDAAHDHDVEEIVDLIVHELGHHIESSHLSERYHRALTGFAARLAFMDPGQIRRHLLPPDQRKLAV